MNLMMEWEGVFFFFFFFFPISAVTVDDGPTSQAQYLPVDCDLFRRCSTFGTTMGRGLNQSH
ncbi:hypothetical protein BP00DRAFT_16115 [Aspergillus indologenus CBS 114.80]|uniref:Secreted protein n=1 Tax=Aspergillus indologenus CBS 114.80 TaxID=1450541 RepID=A0A2V5HV03_9EURO|nr:hypothetical protein BP00DRAFT_16115 [Aspergillus indologenus CBS 114.80]